MNSPSHLIAVLGTATEIGKTWVTCRLVIEMRDRGRAVAVRKPVQSFDPGTGPTDADLLAAASGEQAGAVCPLHRWYEVPMAPPMAVDTLGREPFSGGDLLAELTWPDGIEIGIVETVGGVRSPLADDVDSIGLARLLRPQAMLLVAHAGLGAINDVRLSSEVIRSAVGVDPVVFLNHFDDADALHRGNRAWLADRDGVTVTTAVGDLVDLLAG